MPQDPDSSVFPAVNLIFYLIYNVIHLLDRDHPFSAGEHDTVVQLVPVVTFPRHVLLDHHDRYVFDFFIGGKPLAAMIADPSAPDGIILLHRSGINDSCVILITIWTFHLYSLKNPGLRKCTAQAIRSISNL